MIVSRVLTSLFWSILERGGVQIFQIIFQIIIARLLLPEDYGLMAIVLMLITISKVISFGGLSVALIQKKTVDDDDYSTVLFYNIFASIVVGSLLFYVAPYVGEYFNSDKIKDLIRAQLIVLFFLSSTVVQYAIVSKKLKFKLYFFCSLLSTITSGLCCVYYAFNSGGVWALVVQQIVYESVLCMALFYGLNWRPNVHFSFKRFAKLYSFAWKLQLSSLIETFYDEGRTFIIGKNYNPDVLGEFNRGKQFPSTIVLSLTNAIHSVILPTLSLYQDNSDKLRLLVQKTILMTTFVLFPVMMIMGVYSKEIVLLILTKKWLGVVPFMQIYCFVYAMWPINTANLQAINSIGRSDVYLFSEIIKKTIGLFLLIISLPFGVYVIALSMAVISVINIFINSYPNSKYLKYGYYQQIKDVFPSVLITIIMGSVVVVLKYISGSLLWVIILQIIAGVIIYLLLSYFFNKKPFLLLREGIKILNTRK